jgi:hypothetical protein
MVSDNESDPQRIHAEIINAKSGIKPTRIRIVETKDVAIMF